MPNVEKEWKRCITFFYCLGPLIAFYHPLKKFYMTKSKHSLPETDITHRPPKNGLVGRQITGLPFLGAQKVFFMGKLAVSFWLKLKPWLTIAALIKLLKVPIFCVAILFSLKNLMIITFWWRSQLGLSRITPRIAHHPLGHDHSTHRKKLDLSGDTWRIIPLIVGLVTSIYKP